MLADGQPEDVLRGLQREAEPPHIVAENLRDGIKEVFATAVTASSPSSDAPPTRV